MDELQFGKISLQSGDILIIQSQFDGDSDARKLKMDEIVKNFSEFVPKGVKVICVNGGYTFDTLTRDRVEYAREQNRNKESAEIVRGLLSFVVGDDPATIAIRTKAINFLKLYDNENIK